MILNHQFKVERYAKPNGVASGFIPGHEFFSLLDKKNYIFLSNYCGPHQFPITHTILKNMVSSGPF